MVTQRAEVEPEGRRRELPRDSEQFSLGLENDSYLDRAKLIAGVLSAVLLVGMLVTSLFRAPNVEWTVLLAVVSGVLLVAMSVRVALRRAERRHRTGP
ncbi:MAG: hypothetical protein WCC38_11845 [Pseudonocardiaceae bacterium]